MNDILPGSSEHWVAFEALVHDLMHRFAYENIRTPVLERTQLFVKGTGETTDIVEKEMYSFEDRLNGEQLTLRPENTPGVVRSAIEHNLTYGGGRRLYYMGPMFRHERPQRGRYRQFHQLGVECLGFSGAEVDVEAMLLANQLLQELGIEHVRLELNTLGVLAERQKHRAALIAYFEKYQDVLDEDAKRRLQTNPLRILDTKNPAMQDMVSNAPRLLDFLGDESKKRFDAVQSMLDGCGVSCVVNPRLVRGLDYYCHTVFEFITDALGAQGTICGGGRYDGLFEMLGGKPTPGVGWGLGIERLLDLVEAAGQFSSAKMIDAFAIIPSQMVMHQAMQVLQKLRARKVNIQMHAGTQDGVASMKSQFKKADASGARYALIFGEDEVKRNCVMVKSLRDVQVGESQQVEMSLAQNEELANFLRKS